VLTEAGRTDLVRSSEVFPFDFTKNPMQLSLSVQVPLFNGFATQRQVEQAVAASKDATEGRRAEELRLRTAVTQAHDAVVTQYRVIAIEDTNRAIAEERLTMARQRYALGAANIIELLDAQESVQTAERDWLNARYQFQIDLTSLEAASGVRLRPETE
jgi:outer membrane protein